MIKLKLLFLLKKNLGSGGYSRKVKCSGLYNSASILAEELKETFNVDTNLEIVVDGNAVDKQLVKYKPHIAIIEAIWITPEKMKELLKLHRNIIFVIRIHSEVPFLSNDGVAIEWIRKYAKLPRTIVAFNSKETYNSFKIVYPKMRVNYLPNIYDDIVFPKPDKRQYIKEYLSYFLRPKKISKIHKDEINIGCFGAIRPIKNQLIQAFAAIQFANRFDIKLNFHINATRIEQKGEAVLKNMRALFEGTRHELVEHSWLGREEFLDLVKTMDVGLQVSFNESFNIVSADFVSQGIPCVVSKAIRWMPDVLKVNPINVDEIDAKIEQALIYNYLFKYMQYFELSKYNALALKQWGKFLIP